MFLNGILFNAEIWYGLTMSEVSEFEDLDRLLLRKLLQAQISTPKESYYLELGLIPIGEIIKARRIQYLHNLVTMDESEMLYHFLATQWTASTKGDWTETARKNMDEFGIPIDFNFLQSKPKEVFKTLVK